MKKAESKIKEEKRIASLKNLNILDTPAEKQYDNITELAAYICKTPIAMISLIDENRQWIKSKTGTNFSECPREMAFCSHAILNPENNMEIEDTRLENRFKDNPFVTAEEEPIIFYAGYPIRDKNGNSLGALCILDHKPRKLTKPQKQALNTLRNQVEILFELREKNKELTQSKVELRQHNSSLKKFAGAVSHDLKMPLASIIMTIDILRGKYAEKLDEQGLEYLKRLKQSSLGMSEYISHILEYYETENISSEDNIDKPFALKDFLERIVDILNIDSNCEINFPEHNFDLVCNLSALEQIFVNLLGNSLKYNDKEKTIIDIAAEEKKKYYHFKITDNGMGIPKEEQENIFQLFSIATDRDRHGKKGNGIGLSTVKKIVQKLGGKIKVDSEVGKYTTFEFTIKKQKPTK